MSKPLKLDSLAGSGTSSLNCPVCGQHKVSINICYAKYEAGDEELEYECEDCGASGRVIQWWETK